MPDLTLRVFLVSRTSIGARRQAPVYARPGDLAGRRQVSLKLQQLRQSPCGPGWGLCVSTRTEVSLYYNGSTVKTVRASPIRKPVARPLDHGGGPLPQADQRSGGARPEANVGNGKLDDPREANIRPRGLGWYGTELDGRSGFDVGPLITLTVPPMWCTHGSPGESCPRPARYADSTWQRICQQHAEQRVRTGGLTALLREDQARFLAGSAGYAGGRTDEES
jgi:hypothetical protein